MKRLLTGMEAIARGCAEEGVLLVTSCGAGAIHALLDAARREGLSAERAPGEKVALELAVGASVAGARSLAALDDLAAAAEALHASARAGASGLVVLALDDPGAALGALPSDSRALARALELPCLEPSDAAECKEHLAAALALSERWETPVLMRLTPRVALGGRPVPVGTASPRRAAGLRLDRTRRVLALDHGAPARLHAKETLAQLAAPGAETALHRVELRSRELGVVTSGAPYHDVREALPDASVLKLGLVHPVPTALVRDFAGRVERLVVVEELEPVVESEIRALGIGCRGKDLLPRGELDPDHIARALGGATARARPEAAPPRPAEACAGCPQRGLLHALKRLHVNVVADQGCASAGAAAPLAAIDAAVARGAAVAIAQGGLAVLGERLRGRIVAVTAADDLLRPGALALSRAPERRLTVVAAEASFAPAGGAPADPCVLAAALGVSRVREVDPLDLARTEAALREELSREESSLVIARGRCPIASPAPPRPSRIRSEGCNRCGACLRLGCPAISDRLDAMIIDAKACAGCGLCAQVCRAGAIERAALAAGVSGGPP